MKPHRVMLTHSLVHSYRLDKHFDVFSPQIKPITQFHPEDLLKNYTSLDNDCPSFPGISEYSMRVVSGTLNAARMLVGREYGDGFFPKTGSLCNIGEGRGYRHACNVPLKAGITDECYQYVFEPVVERCIRRIRPDIIVLQCGADSIVGDRIGCFNLSIGGHGRCLEFVKSFGVPMLVLGGGGYTTGNVSRCWTYETSVVCGQHIQDAIPEHDPYYMHYGPEYTMSPALPTKHKNQNTKELLEAIMGFVFGVVDKI
ncbi:UNVERIFIED_CONTAM: hypothetical protein PYX00_011428 [Menopon gallinae]|uniref:Histone deacetylase domain-containing protein n=1 Tax=Menopon gallinae TaxID=328185 RepID=A0AAW2H7M5_9NEOP